LKHGFMTSSLESPVTVEANGHAAALQCGGEGMEEDAPHADMQVRFTMQECFRRIRQFEIELKEAKRREQDLMQQLFKARTQILDQGAEVCNLQIQLAEEIRERQGLLRELTEHDSQICSFQESHADSQAQALGSARERTVKKIAVRSGSWNSNAGSSTVAHGAASNSCIFPFPKACGPILPTLPEQDMKFTPQITPCRFWQQKEKSPGNNFRWIAPSSPSVCGRGMLPKHSTRETVAEAMARQAVADANQFEAMARKAVVDANQFMVELPGMPNQALDGVHTRIIRHV